MLLERAMPCSRLGRDFVLEAVKVAEDERGEVARVIATLGTFGPVEV